jgi:hypothetical protein
MLDSFRRIWEAWGVSGHRGNVGRSIRVEPAPSIPRGPQTYTDDPRLAGATTEIRKERLRGPSHIWRVRRP